MSDLEIKQTALHELDKTKSFKRLLRLLFRLSIAAVLFWLIFRKIPFSNVMDALSTVLLPLLLFGMGVFVLVRAFEALQMHIILKALDANVSIVRIFVISLISMFYDLFLPGFIAGGAIRWYKFSRCNEMKAESLVAIIVNRFTRTGTIFFLGLIFWILHRKSTQIENMGIILIVMTTGCIIGGAIIFASRMETGLLNMVQQFNNRFVPQSLRRKTEKLITSFTLLQGFSRRSVLGILGCAAFSQFLSIVGLFLFARALSMPITFIHGGWVRELTTIASMLPITVMGLGVREGTMVFLLQSYGIEASLCIAISFLVLGQMLFFSIIGGICEIVEQIGFRF